jgi:hypothetical protein
VYNLKPPVATPREQAAEVARFHAEMIAQEARKSPTALVEYLSEHFPARWMQSTAPHHRFWDAPCAEGRLGFTLFKVTASVSGFAVDVIPNRTTLPRPTFHPVELAKELRVAVKMAAAQDPTIVLPEWAI